MSTTSRAAVVSAAVAAMLTALAPAGHALNAGNADSGPGAGLPREVRACVRPVRTPTHSADVVQAWIDGCRRTAGERSSR